MSVRRVERAKWYEISDEDALRNDAEAAADAIDEARQQVNLLYQSIRDAPADGHMVPELEQATGLALATLQNVRQSTSRSGSVITCSCCDDDRCLYEQGYARRRTLRPRCGFFGPR